MAYVRFQSTYHNNTGDDVVWQIDIVDTSGSGGTIQVSTASEPTEEFEGLPQDLKPGIYPTSFRFSVVIENGLQEGLINSVLTSDEGRFLVRIYKDSALQFIGYILPDQCDYEDAYFPYLFNIVAVDGYYRLGTVDYVSKLGNIEYLTCEEIDYEATTYNTGPLNSCLSGSEWIMIEHYSNLPGGEPGISITKTTYARFEQISINSPGSGWVDQGSGIWAKEIPYTNEEITDSPGDGYYRLTRDIDDTPFRPITDYIEEIINATGLASEYGTGMYDTASEWYEHSMNNFTDDPLSMMRISEKPFIGKTYKEVAEEIYKLLYLRFYYAQGRYHIEQISYRDTVGFKRWIYNSAGTLLSTSTSSLDLDTTALDIVVGEGGRFKILAPLKSVQVTLKTDTNDLLQGVIYDEERQGTRYLGQIAKKANHKFKIRITSNFYSAFDGTVMATVAAGLQAEWARHSVTHTVQVRLVEKTSGVTYWLTPPAELPLLTEDTGTWEIAEGQYYKLNTMGINPPFGDDQLNYTNPFGFQIITETLPGSVDDLFDVYVSIIHGIRWFNAVGNIFWNVTNAGAFTHEARTIGSSMKSQDNLGEPIDPEATRVYYIENTVSNSLKIESEVLYGDVVNGEQSIEIYDGSNWIKSNAWSIGGVGTAQDLVELLCAEIIGLRMKPRLIYTTEWLSTQPSADNRLLKGGNYYLPLRVNRNTDLDGFNGEFLQIAKTTAPGGGVLVGITENDIAPPNLGGGGGDQDILPPVLVLETNEIISPGTYTECDIVNTLQVHVPSGAVCRIQHPTTPSTFQNVTLTQAIEPTDTVMYFTSVAIAGTFPDASPIYIEPQAQPDVPVGITNFFDFFAESYYGNAVTAPSYDFTLLSGIGTAAIDKRILVERHGKRIYYNPAASTLDPVEQMKFWEWDSDAPGSFFFAIPLDNESLLIRAR